MTRGYRTVVATLLAFGCAAPAQAAPGWTPVFTPTFLPSQVVMGPDGTVVFSEAATGSNLASVQVRPPGGPLLPVQTLASASSNAPVIGVGPDGTFAATWVESNLVKTAVMKPGATTFGDVVPIPQVSPETPTGVYGVALDHADDAWVLFSTTINTNPRTIRLRLGRRPLDDTVQATSQEINAYTASSGQLSDYRPYPALAMNGAGDIAVAWMREDNASSTVDDSVFAAVRPASASPSGAFLTSGVLAHGRSTDSPRTMPNPPTVAISPAGAVGLLWSATTIPTSGPATYSVNFLRGTSAAAIAGSAENPALAGATPASNPSSRLGMLPDGRAVVAWIGTINTTNRVQVATAHGSGSGFDAAQTIVAPKDPATAVSLAVSGTGEILAAVVDGSGPCSFYGAVAPPGGTFGPTAPLGTEFTATCGLPAIAAGTGADGVAAWTGFRGSPSTRAFEAAGLDGTPPTLSGVSIPSSGAVGASLPFSSSATDVWGPVTTSWAFGDGGTADGAAPSHTFTAAGTPTVTVTATDGVGNASSASGPVTITAPGGDTTTDTTAPVVSGLSLTNKTFAVGKAPTALVAAKHRRPKPKRGTTIRLTLSEPATLKIGVLREAVGRHSGKRCVKPTHKNRRAKHCTRLVRVGGLTRTAKQGANRFAFSGRLGSKALAPGRYRLRILANDAAGNTAKPKILRLKIIRP